MVKYLQNLKYNVKRACIFHLISFGILSILILSVKNRVVVGLLLHRQNPLSVTKVSCRQSLSSQKLLELVFYQPLKERKRKY